MIHRGVDEIHNYGLDEIPIQTHLFDGNEILVLEAVCTVFHYCVMSTASRGEVSQCSSLHFELVHGA
jgi:hypothetical protein